MNDKQSNSKAEGNSKSNFAKWQKFAWAAILLLAVAYHFGRPTLEKWTGMSLPALDGSQTEVADLPDEKNVSGDDNESKNEKSDSGVAKKEKSISGGPPPTRKSDSNGQRDRIKKATKSKANLPNGPPKGIAPKSGTSASRNPFELKDIGRKRLMSPAGLVYAMGPRGEHRVDHVMRHTIDDLSKPAHGVFDAKSKNEVLGMIDRAYQRIKSKKIKPMGRDRDREEFVINMGKVIGYKGGKAGRRTKKKLNRLKLILQDGNQVVTAFPY